MVYDSGSGYNIADAIRAAAFAATNVEETPQASEPLSVIVLD